MSDLCIQTSDVRTLRREILDRIGEDAATHVWTPTDFADLGSRSAVDKNLQRLARIGALRRIGRGLYDQPRLHLVTERLAAADYRVVIVAGARRDHLRMLVDGGTARNDLGLATGRVVLHTNARRRSIGLVKRRNHRVQENCPQEAFWGRSPCPARRSSPALVKRLHVRRQRPRRRSPECPSARALSWGDPPRRFEGWLVRASRLDAGTASVLDTQGLHAQRSPTEITDKPVPFLPEGSARQRPAQPLHERAPS